MDRTHDPNLMSWVESANAAETEFPVQNLPFGTFRRHGEQPGRLGVAIGDQVLDVSAALEIDAMENVMAMPQHERSKLRLRISDFLMNHAPRREEFLIPMSDVEMLLPCRIGDYTDFYASIDHATNVGRMFRPDSPLLPNYKWMPIAYHGRSSSIIVSGTGIHRPSGQIAGQEAPVFSRSARLDYEAEIGAFLGPGNPMGQPIPIAEAEDHLFGVCLLNDWSARDIQAWEYQPLGPFLAKNFATSISPWIVTREALEPFRCPVAPRPEGDPEPLPHLRASGGPYRHYFAGVVAIPTDAGHTTGTLTDKPERLSPALLDSGPDDRASHLERLPDSTRRPDRQRYCIRTGETQSRVPARNDLRRRGTPRTTHRRET